MLSKTLHKHLFDTVPHFLHVIFDSVVKSKSLSENVDQYTLQQKCNIYESLLELRTNQYN